MVGGELAAGADEELPDPRCVELCSRARLGGDDGNVTPADHLLALARHGRGEQLLELLAASPLTRQEADGDAVLTRRRQVELTGEKRVRKLDEDAGAVAGLGVRAGRPAVLEPLERSQRPDDHLVLRAGVEPRHERDPASVVLDMPGRTGPAPSASSPLLLYC